MSSEAFPLKKLSWQHYVAVVILAFVAYAPTLKVGFMWDDHVIIEHNPWIRQWSTANLRHDFLADNTQGNGDDYYRPLQAVYHTLGYSLFGPQAWGYHFLDLCVHAAAGLLLLQLILALGFSPMTALLAACLFVVHPGGIEQLLTASGVTTPLSYAFTLVCLLSALQEESLLWWLVSLLTFACALGVKEIAIATPALVVCVYLYKRMPLRRYLLLVPMGLIAIIYLGLRHRVVHVQGEFPLPLVMLFAIKAFPRILLHYVTLTLWPWNLHSHRQIPHLTHLWPLIDAGWIGLTGSCIWRKNRVGLFCIGWLVVNLLPTTVAMIPGGFMLDHWSYQANLAIILPLAMFFDRQWELHAQGWHKALALLYFPLLIVWALLVHLNVEIRGTDEKLYRWALHFTTSRPLEYNLGVVLMQDGRPAEALPYFEDVRAYYPDDLNNTHALALAYWQAGHRWVARDILRKLLARHPDFLPAQQSWAMMQAGHAPPTLISPRPIAHGSE